MQFVYSKPMKPWQGILFGLIFVVLGIGLLFLSVFIIRNYNQKSKTYTEVTAVVVDYAYDDEGLTAIIVSYEVNGNSYRKQSNTYSSAPKSKGTQVQLKYNPDNPSDAIWVNDSTNIVLPLVGGMFTLVGTIFVVINAKKMKNEQNTSVIQQSNGLYNSADVVNTLPNNQSMGQQTSQIQQLVQQQANQTEQVSQYQQPNSQIQQNVPNQVHDTITNSSYPTQQEQANNQNNMNSNL